ncbi:hypothetical protein IWQ60_007482 [Tieghemiomyces parasiticus]|uniref:Thioredoxin domain-containing protein n=1 Tax=Tieghemiomyces parasiticus TaxID=78921 RepID=A0A9W8DNY4_9FUNG|nr:hypothetical protein IWQ60_007482 [Tieghemiomyces parasiticus]
MTNIVEIKNQGEFDQFIQTNPQAVVQLTNVPNGQPDPTLEAASNDITNVKFARVNVVELPAIAKPFNLNTYPTYVLYKNGDAWQVPLTDVTPEGLKAMAGVFSQ